MPDGLFPHLPPLRNRGEDVPLPLGGGLLCDHDLLAGQLLIELSAQYGGGRLGPQIEAPEAAEAAGRRA